MPYIRASSTLIQFNVPVEVITPAQGCIFDPHCKRDHRHPPGFHRYPDEPHLCFFRSPATLLIIARKTGRYDVLPRGFSTLHLGNNMVERQVLRRVFDPAILAEISVALVDIGPREPHLPFCAFYPDKFEKPEDGRQFERDGYTPDIPVIAIDHLHLSLGEQG